MKPTATTKRLTYIFEDDAPLPSVKRWNLAEGLFLAPLQSWLLSLDQDWHLLAISPEFSNYYRDHMHKTTLNVEYSGRSDLNYEDNLSEESKAKQKIDCYLLAGMIYGSRFVMPEALVVTIPGDRKICHSNQIKDFAALDYANKNTFARADFKQIDRLYSAVTKVLDGESSGRLPISLRYYQQAFRTDIDGPVRFLGMMMAMESLFSPGASEISHQVSERTAFFLKNKSRERELLYDQMRKHYGLRSTIAHGGSSKKRGVDFPEAFKSLLFILRDVLLKVLQDDSLTSIFDSAEKEAFNKALAKLVFRGKIDLNG